MFRNKLPRNNPNLNGGCCQYGNFGIHTKGCRLTLHSTFPPLWLISPYAARKILSKSVAACARNVCNLNSKSLLLLLGSLTFYNTQLCARARTHTHTHIYIHTYTYTHTVICMYVQPSDILHFQSISNKLIHKMNTELKIYGNKIKGMKRALGKEKSSQKIQNVMDISAFTGKLKACLAWVKMYYLIQVP